MQLNAGSEQGWPRQACRVISGELLLVLQHKAAQSGLCNGYRC